MKWHSVKSKLPDPEEAVMIRCRDPHQPNSNYFLASPAFYCDFANEFDWTTYSYDLNHVTHWRELPVFPDARLGWLRKLLRV